MRSATRSIAAELHDSEPGNGTKHPQPAWAGWRISIGAFEPVILIVEDEFLLRMDSAEMNENAGFEVIQAGNADEAIAILQARPAIHVIFTDVQMPGSMDGLKLARFVRNHWPPIKILATLGLVRVVADDLPAGSVFLPKPYRGALLGLGTETGTGRVRRLIPILLFGGFGYAHL